MSVTFDVLKLLKFNDFKSRQPKNIPDIFVTFDVLKVFKSRLAKSCYDQVVSKVDELGKYRNYNKSYYDNTLVPQVDQKVTDYDNKAAAIFGSKENVNALWNRAKAHYNNAMEYYGE